MKKKLAAIWDVLVMYEIVPWGVIWLIALLLVLNYLNGGGR